MVEHQSEVIESRVTVLVCVGGQGTVIRNMRRGLVASRMVSVSNTVWSHGVAVATEWGQMLQEG